MGAAKKTPKQKGPAGETSVAPAAALSWSTAREAARCHKRARSRGDPAVGQRRAGFDALAPRSLGDAVVAFPACSSHFFHLGCAAQLRVQAAAAADLLCPLCHGCFCSGCSAQGWTDRGRSATRAVCPAVRAQQSGSGAAGGRLAMLWRRPGSSDVAMSNFPSGPPPGGSCQPRIGLPFLGPPQPEATNSRVCALLAGRRRPFARGRSARLVRPPSRRDGLACLSPASAPRPALAVQCDRWGSGRLAVPPRTRSQGFSCCAGGAAG